MLYLAHAFGQRYELPLPLWLFVFGGAGVVFLSFLLVMQRRVGKQKRYDETDQSYITPLSTVWAAVTFAFLAFLIFLGFDGSQEVAENFLPVFFWLVIWVVLPLSCGVIGDWTQKFNPFASVAKLADSDKLRKTLVGRNQVYEWPKWLGWWFAAAVYFSIACGELIFNESATKPFNLALWLTVYFLVSAFGGFLYGKSWIRRGEVFSVLYYTWGKLGFFRFGNSGEQSFAGGLIVPFEASISRIIFVILLLASISFDGLLSTPLWSHLQHQLPQSFTVQSLPYQLVACLVFFALTMALWLLFSLFARAVVKAGNLKGKNTEILAGLLPSILPISFGYLLAHYLEYLVVNGQLFFPLLGNPLGKDNWPIHLASPFNDDFHPNTHLLPSAFYWYFSVVVIVLVHVVAVIIAHRHLGSNSNKVGARRSEYPWIAAMVAYTMFSLWLLAQPLVKEKTTVKESFAPVSSHIQLKG